ncbi:2TM domain-containing protein [Seonamhaeicola marinus]|uniref:2TM domain-containing protein n=1 Tax=Seonamhaeicola marinus TaxID=1912246 RepID=A0A5D0IMK9_9FLAO|nr:2TM domain-containing protein [Seonamhaeicola marinus]TYA84251.1 2TM domain-containing protein [Seonamhaeicola marinus]
MRRLEESSGYSKFEKEDAYFRAKQRVKELKGFYGHAFWYVLVNIFIIVMIGVNSNWNIWHFGTLATPLFWGIGLAFHAIGVFGKHLFFSKSWEERKIRQFMDQEED